MEAQLRAREEFLLPIYHQVAVQFADLHDTPGRMQEKGVITVMYTAVSLNTNSISCSWKNTSPEPRISDMDLSQSRAIIRLCKCHWFALVTWWCFLQDILDWKNARSFFYWRLRRLLLEEKVKSEIVQTNGDLSDGHIKSMLRRWFIETEGTVKVRQFKKTNI